MRIRNRSCSSVLSSRGSCEKGRDRAFPDGLEEDEEKFLLPLAATAMDAQKAEDDDHQIDGVAAHTISGTGTRVIRRPGHKWRDILLRFSAGNIKSCEAIKVDSWEGAEKPKFNGNTITMRSKGDNISFLENEGMNREVVEKGSPSNSCYDEAGITSDYRECNLPKLGRSENNFMSWKHEHNLVESGDVCTNKRRRTKKNRSTRDDIECINAWRSCDKKTFIITEKEVEIIRKDKLKAPDKPMANNNSHVGSQCRRRNGRGWRCSQRTLVGYSLCEHHLGKGRIKSINNGTVILNNKVPSKFKELRVLDASSSWKFEPDHHDQRSKKRSLKLIN
uniref:WRC domain-containing protein n=1 Tax=Picea sitchensis TaxID=3332 RepID=A9NN28_PICSI|nr:unknown [Picea sitchensis]